jgi:predicted MFS family arabinose efflux permease
MGLYSIFLGLGQIIGGGFGGIFARAFGFDGLIYLTVILACVALPSLLWLAWFERKAHFSLQSPIVLEQQSQ